MQYQRFISSNVSRGVFVISLIVVVGFLLWAWGNRHNKASDSREIVPSDTNVVSLTRNAEVATNESAGDHSLPETDENGRRVNGYELRLSSNGSSLRIEQNGKLRKAVQGTQLSFPCDTFSANSKNGDRVPVVMVEDFTGGNHCCLSTYYVELGQSLKAYFDDGSPGCPKGDDPDGNPKYEGTDFTPFNWEYAACCQYRGITTTVSTYRNGKVTFRLDLMKKATPSLSELTAKADELRGQLSLIPYKGGSYRAFQYAVMALDDTELFPDKSGPADLSGFETKPDPNFFDVIVDLVYTGNERSARQFLDLVWPADKKGKERFIRDFKNAWRSEKVGPPYLTDKVWLLSPSSR